MICLQCDNEQFLPRQDAVLEQEFKGERLQIQTPAMVCSKCGWVTVDLAQADELRKRTADAYRKKHGLLTSDEIKARRKLLALNQREFAAFLSVGEASVKRWETWLVQERSSDQLIRMKCDKAIRDQLVQAATEGVWFSISATFTELAHGIAVQHIPAANPVSARWDYQPPTSEPEPAPSSQLEFCEAAAPDTTGLSPPEQTLIRAFSFSMPSPSRPMAEGIEKENDHRTQPQPPDRSRASYADNPATLPIAA